MNKLVWVFLPLLAAALLAGALALRGRLPTRARLNAISSLLLLVYLLATAGLGIFWVANQHLPVFDWHYLFGYATVLLLVLHLVFNLRALLAALRPRRQTASAPAAAAPRRRRLSGALALGGLAIGSSDEARYQPGMATTFLRQLADVAREVMQRFLVLPADQVLGGEGGPTVEGPGAEASAAEASAVPLP